MFYFSSISHVWTAVFFNVLKTLKQLWNTETICFRVLFQFYFTCESIWNKTFYFSFISCCSSRFTAFTRQRTVRETKFQQKLTGPLMVFKVSRTTNPLMKTLASLISGLAELFHHWWLGITAGESDDSITERPPTPAVTMATSTCERSRDSSMNDDKSKTSDDNVNTLPSGRTQYNVVLCLFVRSDVHT